MATLEQVFQREKAWIAACDDPDALIEKIGDYREDLRVAERDGNMLMRMRAGDLVELARARVLRLNARETREAAAANPEPPAEKPRTPQAAPTEPAVTQPAREAMRPREADDGARRRAQEAAALAAAEKAKADARMAAAEAAKIELENELLRAKIEAAKRPVVAHVAPSTPRVGSTLPAGHRAQAARGAAPVSAGSPTISQPTAPRVSPVARPASPPKPAPARDGLVDGYTEADRLALASVGRWPPTPLAHRGSFWTKHDDWPRDWTLTGGDLGRFRGELNLTRAVFAAQLGVPSAVVKDAEMSPRERVGPALQIALRRAMDHAAEERRRLREERAAAEAAGAPREPVVAAEVPTATPPAPAHLAGADKPVPGPVTFTGADLARVRAERRLSQREMADLLGVEQGTISKGEGKAGAALGPALQEAMARLAAGGAPAIPE